MSGAQASGEALLLAKAAARRRAFDARKAAFVAGSAAVRAATTHLLDLLAAHEGRTLAGYMPIRTEIDPRPAMTAHRGPVAVPVVEAPGAPLRFRHWTPVAAMEPGAFGAPVPAGGDWLEPEVLIVPLLAFDAMGYRLGYGGGFYDRTLEGLRTRGPVTAIGLAFAAQAQPEVPREPTDQPLDLIVTEEGVLRPE